MRFEKKGSGAIVFVGDIAVKASSIDHKFSMGKLCKRLGAYQPGDYSPVMPLIEPKPLSKIAEAQRHEYMNARKTAQEAHKKEKEEIRKNNELALAEVRARQKAYREKAFVTLAQYGPEFVGIARILLPKQHREEMAAARKELTKTPKLAYGRFKEWLRRILTPGMKYGQFVDGQFPKVGKLQNPLIAYREMIKRRHAEFNKSRLEASIALHLRCAGYLRKEVEEEMERHSPAPAHQDDLSPKIGYLRRILDYA